ncbi:MAG: hypothetical protein NTY47_08470, partial [Candidatus Omnitrophica bacterium]|nr:hypothetical protein [Candidatus Omnitrophota bacterium]
MMTKQFKRLILAVSIIAGLFILQMIWQRYFAQTFYDSVKNASVPNFSEEKVKSYKHSLSCLYEAEKLNGLDAKVYLRLG